jgi:glucokinase
VRILVGDIGGTKTGLAIAAIDHETVALEHEQRYPSREYAGLGAIVQRFLAETGARGERACFGVAGPVIDNRCEATNLPWVIDGDELSRALQLGPTRLVNDFVAGAYGVLRIGLTDRVQICPGEPTFKAPIAVLGAGTGLGQAYLVWTGDCYEVLPSEGGHADFAPRDERQIGLLRYLLTRHKRVSYERVISGIGLPEIYAYLRDAGVAPESPEVRAQLASGEDAGAVIGPRAVSDSDALCRATMDLFVSAYGAEAGNMALRGVTRGGVYLIGGIAPKILPRMTDGLFRQAFLDKGRLSDLVERIPAYVVTHPRVSLLGAAHAGLR